MNLEPPKAEIKSATRVTGGPATPRKGPPKFKQRQTRQFKSKPPKKGVQGFGDDIPGMEGLGTDITVICPWEAFNHLELHELAQYDLLRYPDTNKKRNLLLLFRVLFSLFFSILNTDQNKKPTQARQPHSRGMITEISAEAPVSDRRRLLEDDEELR
ncbi:hypothetical protein ATANTOWER_003355 [Ataeniobius toweri]|uniref:Retinal rod rhodopsin-sensitive cGMP 3',5'-cyclic phosphodiesterase subunit gamma n=1 Tax=Ataeniobius toweri TaxID=208326 RepID=A0ABU7BWI0_9TELE|nr:hypothetical protein [Ataeniobius toweri]